MPITVGAGTSILDAVASAGIDKTDQRGVNFDWVELCRTGADWVDLSIPYPPSAGPGGPFGIVGRVCPVDEQRSGVFFWRYRRVEDWQRAS